jgi:hypothetical protein
MKNPPLRHHLRGRLIAELVPDIAQVFARETFDWTLDLADSPAAFKCNSLPNDE